LGNDEIRGTCDCDGLWNQLDLGGDMLRVMNFGSAEEWRMPFVRVLIVDDFELWKGFVIARLQEQPDLCIVGFASDGFQAAQKAEDLQPDLILLDISLPRLNGLEAARQIRKLAPKSKILFLTGDADSDVVRAAFHAGGSGCVLKTDAATELLTGMAAVLQGKQFLSLSIKDVDDLSEPRDPEFEDQGAGH
jgi:DNA-binding NarL/FixJ family response regulator